jgi:preprotein translocase subunit SecA
MKEGEELEHPWLNRSIESAQKKVEQQNYSIRKRLLQYDDVLNQQREVIYGIRNAAIHAERPKDIIFEQIEEELFTRLEVAGFGEKVGPTKTAIEGVVGWLNAHFPISIRVEELSGDDPKALVAMLLERIKEAYAVKESVEIPEALGSLERYVVINAIDHHWQEHLTEMEELRRSIGLRSYGQKDPLVEYKGEAYKYFEELMNNVRLQICTGLFRSASNLESFENMLALLSRTARSVGPADLPAPHAGGASAAAPVRVVFPPRRKRRFSSPRSPFAVKRRRWAATIPVPAAAGRSSRIATGREGGPDFLNRGLGRDQGRNLLIGSVRVCDHFHAEGFVCLARCSRHGDRFA